jgi:hypothetical protein
MQSHHGTGCAACEHVDINDDESPAKSNFRPSFRPLLCYDLVAMSTSSGSASSSLL